MVRSLLKYVFLISMLPLSAFAQTAAPLVPVKFEFFKVLGPDDSGVGINGSFNNWGNNPDGSGSNKHVIPLQNVGNNLWETTVSMQSGLYEYKFVTYTVGQSGDTTVSSWITDPLNSNYGGPYNNSRINVADPMIYYLQPMNQTSSNNRKPDITAKISWAENSSLNPSSLKLLIDNVPVQNPAQYFDTTSRSFSYVPPEALTFDQHTVEMYVENSGGVSADVKTTFKIVNEIVSAPYTFYFDPKSPNVKLIGKVNKVEIKGTFNNLGADPMAGPDSDGLYKYTVPLNIGAQNFYQFIINGGQYINDPDNPLMEKDFGTLAIKRVEPYPHFEIKSPRQGQLFTPGGNLSVDAQIIESDSNYAIDKNSLKIYLDDNPITVASADSIDRGLELKSGTFSIAGGRHQLKLQAADTSGVPAEEIITFGAYPANTGFHYVDEDGDDNGPGKYTYPSFSPSGTADIKSIDINADASGDSLLFTVRMAAVSDYTRLGFEIINSLDGPLNMAPDNASIQIPDVNNKGIFFVVTPPNSAQKSAYVNKTYTNFDLSGSTDSIVVNQDAETSGIFKFSIPLSVIESATGSFSKGWYFLSYSYLGNPAGGWKVAPGNGGSFFSEQPNIYDAAFFFNNMIEKRELSNFNYSFNYGGSRYVKLASNERGVLFLKPQDISASLSSKPYVHILTDGGDIRWGDSVRVYVSNSDSSITAGTLSVNSHDYNLSFVNDTAYADIVLTEGENALQASVNYGQGLASYSAKVYFNRIIDHKPVINISKSISGGNVNLDASGTTNPDNLPQTFYWTQDSTNPAPVQLSGAASSTAAFAVPEIHGQYFFTVKCFTAKDTSFERVALVADSSGASFPDISSWHAAWIDSAVIYEVFVRTFSLDGNLKALTRRIPYIKSLGVNAIWLMPIYPGPPMSPSQPGYAITNYFNVNPSYGTLKDFKDFVNSAHANGLRVMLDYVVNHTHNTHPYMLDAVKFGNKSPFYNFYYWNPDGTYKYADTWTDLPSINYSYARNRDYLLDAAKFWLENFNIDGFRCDAARYVDDRPEGPAFWRRFRSELKTIKPDVFLIGELDATNLNYFDRKFDSGYDYSVYNAIKNSISNVNLLPNLKTALDYYASSQYPNYLRPFRFLENHDEARFISQYSLDQTKLAASVLFALPGVPLIYAGQEVGEPSYRGLINWVDSDTLTPFYKKLVSIRHDYNAYTSGKYEVVSTSSPDSIFAFARISDSVTAVTAANFTGAAVKVSFDTGTLQLKMKAGQQYYFNDVLNEVAYPISSSGGLSITLPGYCAADLVFSDKAIVTAVNNKTEGPAAYYLQQNYPNPFNPTTTIGYSVGGLNNAPVKLDIFNILGQKVKTLVNNDQMPGFHTVQWNGRNNFGSEVSSGVYFYVLKVNSFVQTKKMILLK